MTLARRKSSTSHLAFWPILVLCLMLWFLYRALFHFPVWFDETIGKALFFGLPVWLYVSITGYQAISDSINSFKFRPGLMTGLAFGGILGFAATLARYYQNNIPIQAAWVFASDAFWVEFGLALLTGFWETLFFFSFVQSVLQDKYRSWPWLKQLLLTALIFWIFHVPNSLLRFSGAGVWYQLFLMFFFALGQAFLFTYKRNAFTLIITQALWGMVLLIHYGPPS